MNALSTLPEPPTSSTLLFDIEQFSVLGELQEEGDAEVIHEVVHHFLQDADALLDQLSTEIAADHLETSSELAHSLKGGFATFGLMRAHSLAQELEHLAQAGETEQLSMLCRAMLGCFLAGKRALLVHLEREQTVRLMRAA